MPRRKITATSIAKGAADELPDLTGQQLRFVECLLSGKTGADAYRIAYNCSDMLASTVIAAASRLRANTSVSAWLSAARQAHLGTAVLTRDMHLAELERLREIAVASGNVGAAVQAEMYRGKVSGHHVDQVRDVTATSIHDTLADIAALSPQLAAELAAAHGIEGFVQPISHASTKH